MKVHFYDFRKRENSTKRPPGSGTVYECKLKAASGVLNPIITLQIGTETLPDFNYCYIEEYRRYYYITEWINNGALWTASLNCDILATWRTEIGTAELYILRSSESFDGNIVDTFYPETCRYITVKHSQNTTWIPDRSNVIDMREGTYILGIVSKPLGNHGYYNRGSIVYYAMDHNGIEALINALLDDSLLTDNQFDPDDASLALQKSIVSPLDYIKTCFWVPFTYDTQFGVELQTLYVWDWTLTDVSNRAIIQTHPYFTFPKAFDISPHPQAAERGRYLNIEPYTRMKLYYPPFGLFDLDTTKLVDSATVRTLCSLDLATGEGILKIYSQNDNELLQIVKSQIGVPVQLSQVVKDYINAGLSAVGGVVGTVTNALTGNVLGAIKSGFTGISSTVQAMKPQVSTVGSSGAVIDLPDDPTLYQQFFYVANEDLEHVGRPLCRIMMPSALGGYMLVREGDVVISGLRGEQAYIKEVLEGGFFYE